MAYVGDPDWESEGLKIIEEFEAWQAAQIRRESWTPVGDYKVMIKTKKGRYRVETLALHKNPDGNLGCSYNGFDGHITPILGVTISSINKKTIDALLIRLITGQEELRPINPATKVGNYLNLVTNILSEVRVH